LIDDASRAAVAIICATWFGALSKAGFGSQICDQMRTIGLLFDRLQRKRVEIGSPVEGVDPFGLLEPVDNNVSQRRREGLIRNLKSVG